MTGVPKIVLWVAAGITLIVGGWASSGRAADQPLTLTPDEAVRLEALRDASERVRAAYGRRCTQDPCVPMLLPRDTLEAVAIWDAALFRIRLHRRALAAGVDARPAFAHELSHWLLGHTGVNCLGQALECETAANAEAVRVLRAGWALSQDEAVALMYNSLLSGLRRERSLRGHETFCTEVTMFARTFNLVLPSCASPGG